MVSEGAMKHAANDIKNLGRCQVLSCGCTSQIKCSEYFDGLLPYSFGSLSDYRKSNR